MPQVFRLVSVRHAGHAFDGEGARVHGGRWNPRGQRMVYTAASRALAALEMLVNADWQELTAKRYVVLPAAVPDGLVAQVEALYGLPPEWTATPPPAVLPALGARWLHEAPTPVLSVPSAVLPAERNFLLNPAHARFAEIRTGPAEPFAFDPRLVPATGVPPPRT